MIKKRVIPLMLSKGESLVKGKNFNNHRVVGSMKSLLRIWSDQEVDELMLLNIDSRPGSAEDFLKKVSEASSSVDFPLSVGGGVRTIEYARKLLMSGADKVVVCSKAIDEPSFIFDLASEFGSQAVVAVIDYRRQGSKISAYTEGGSKLVSNEIVDLISVFQTQGVGEIVLQNVDLEGSKQGLDMEILKVVAEIIEVPLIVSGGVGNFEHLRIALENPIVSGVSCGSIFYFGDNSPIRARAYLRNAGLPMRKSR